MRSRYLAKQNRGVKFFELVQISPTRQDVVCLDRDADLELRNVLCGRKKNDYQDLHKTAQRTLL